MKHEEHSIIMRQRLAEWLKMWQLALKLDEIPVSEACIPTGRTPLNAPKAKDNRDAETVPRMGTRAPLLAGAIILLLPDNETTRTRPVYVALVEAVHNSHWLVVPFGRFPLPAVPGELATSRQAVPLKVLCIWNAAQIDAQQLTNGWQVGKLNPQEKRWVRKLLNLPPGARPPETLALRLGPPLIHPLDPRHDYLEQERMLWFKDTPTNRCDEATTSYASHLNKDVPQAAEKRDPYLDNS